MRETLQNNSTEGIVFQIQKFCTDDGPGIRTTVFLKGCPLRCLWCHNPEGLSTNPVIQLDLTRCMMCGKCEMVCEKGCHIIEHNADSQNHKLLTSQCIQCGTCIEQCHRKAILFCGKTMPANEVMKVVLADKGFYDSSGGGITLSGGEPLLQTTFAYALLKEAKSEGIHTCVETSGSVSFEKIEVVTPYVDLFLYDIKETDELSHIKFTGVSNQIILDNIRKLNKLGNKIIMRCPIIPGVNDRHEHFDKLIELYDSLENVIDIQLMPYHMLGQGKQSRYGDIIDSAFFEVPTPQKIEEWNEYIQNRKRGKSHDF